MLIIAYVRSCRKGIAYARRVTTELDAAKLHLPGAQHGARDVLGVNARVVRGGTVVVLAVCRNLADEIFAFHRGGDVERLLVAYDLGVVIDIAAGPGRAGEPSVGPSAGIGDGLSQSAVPVVLDLIVHVCPKRIVRVERARLRGIRVVLILGVLDIDLGVGGQRVGRGGCGGIGLSCGGNRSGRDGRRLLGSDVGFGRGLLCRLLVGRRLLLGVDCGVGRGVVGRGRVLGRLLLGSDLGLWRRRELVDRLGERGRRHEGRRRNKREQQREHALRQRIFGFHIPRLLPFRGPGGQVGSAGCAPAIRPSQRADARRHEQASLEHSLSTDPESNRNPFFSTRRSSCSNRALKLLS